MSVHDRVPRGGSRDSTLASSRRERARAELAEIAAGGATKREIARRLYLSPKTVEMHLRSAYRKLALAGHSGLAPRCADRETPYVSCFAALTASDPW
jgi:DNA-binding CsgD family transcriptional regulator